MSQKIELPPQKYPPPQRRDRESKEVPTPTGQIEGMAKKRKKKISAISMGQGQEPAAHALVQHGFASGDWVLCQNCHLGLPFLKEVCPNYPGHNTQVVSCYANG